MVFLVHVCADLFSVLAHACAMVFLVHFCSVMVFLVHVCDDLFRVLAYASAWEVMPGKP